MHKFEDFDSYKRIDCRVCKAEGDFVTVFDLGAQPAANALIDNPNLHSPKYPLRLQYCDNCSFLQLDTVVDPDVLFGDYLYLSSTAESFRKHFEDYAQSLFDMDLFQQYDFVIDIGSNDGILLKPFQKLGAHVIGIDPAHDIAMRANSEGLTTMVGSFGYEMAKEILEDRKNQIGVVRNTQASIITANNVFAHVDDLDDLLAGVNLLLRDDGYFIVEMPYVGEMIKNNTFDLIYHEHLSYFSFATLERLLKRSGFRLDAAIRQEVHGGSFRYFIRKAKAPNNGLVNIDHKRNVEAKLKLDSLQTYINFAAKVADNKAVFAITLADLKAKRKTIHGYGAPAKATTMLNYFDLPDNYIEKVYDDNPVKQGKYIPGTNIKIEGYDAKGKQPDYMVLFAWNFAKDIMDRLHEQGYKGKFILPVPEVKIYD